MTKIKLIQITAGRGPSECTWVVPKVTKLFLEAAGEAHLQTRVLTREKGELKNTFLSICILLEGKGVSEFLDEWLGTIKWIEQSPFRKYHKRKSWFIGISELAQSNTNLAVINDNEIYYETFRAGGPGGQHVNKVETAVRATHKSTRIAVVARNSKSQMQNKKEAKRKLMEALNAEKINAIATQQKEGWQQHTELERGNPIKIFKQGSFKPVYRPKKFRDKRQKENKNWE